MKVYLNKTLLAGMLVISSVTSAYADGAYLSGNFGVALPTAQDEAGQGGYMYGVDAGVSVGLAFGAEVTDNYRIEWELIYQQNKEFESYSDTNISEKKSINLHTVGGLFNGYYVFKNSTDFSPYISAGVGGAGLFYGKNDYGLEYGTAAFMYQGSTGVDYYLSEGVSLGVKYRYLGFAGSNLHSDPNTHNFSVGINLYF